jgi:hypothetical protein
MLFCSCPCSGFAYTYNIALVVSVSFITILDIVKTIQTMCLLLWLFYKYYGKSISFLKAFIVIKKKCYKVKSNKMELVIITFSTFRLYRWSLEKSGWGLE